MVHVGLQCVAGLRRLYLGVLLLHLIDLTLPLAAATSSIRPLVETM